MNEVVEIGDFVEEVVEVVTVEDDDINT